MFKLRPAGEWQRGWGRVRKRWQREHQCEKVQMPESMDLGTFVETEEVQNAGRAARKRGNSPDVSAFCLKFCLWDYIFPIRNTKFLNLLLCQDLDLSTRKMLSPLDGVCSVACCSLATSTNVLVLVLQALSGLLQVNSVWSFFFGDFYLRNLKENEKQSYRAVSWYWKKQTINYLASMVSDLKTNFTSNTLPHWVFCSDL